MFPNFVKLIVTLILSATIVPIPGFAFSGGDGSQQSPFIISVNDDWKELATTVSSDPMSTYGKYYVLSCDITTNYSIGSGYDEKTFYGNIDGNGHTILMDLELSRCLSAGLFASVSNASFSNLNVTGVIKVYSTEFDVLIGGFCAKANNSSFYNCTNNMTIDYTDCSHNRVVTAGGFCGKATSSNFKDCANKSPITSFGESNPKYVGGFAGETSDCTFEFCSNAGTITGQTSMSYAQPDDIYAGGLIGKSSGDAISNCFNKGNVSSKLETDLSMNLHVYSSTGGLIGYADGSSITKSYNVGNISGGYAGSFTNRYHPRVGGIYGEATSQTTTVNSCFVDCNIRVTTDGNYGLIGCGAYTYNCYASESCIVSKGNGATAHGTYTTCPESDIRSSEWLISNLSFDFNEIWWQSNSSALPTLKMNPTVRFSDPEFIYGIPATGFATSDNSLSPLTFVSLDGKMTIEDNKIIPVSSGATTLRIEQNAAGQWKSYEKTLELEISKKNLTIQAPDISCVYGNPIPDIILTYNGFVLDDSESDLTRQPVISCRAVESSDAGEYPITVSGAEIENYDLTYVYGKLSILKANQTIEWAQEFGSVLAGHEIELTAGCTSGLPLSYTTSDETIARIIAKGDKKYVAFLNPGVVSISAMQEGNVNYNEAQSVTKSALVQLLVSGIRLSDAELTLNVGQSRTITAMVTPELATDKTLVWTTDDEDVVSVDNDGNVTARAKGDAIVTASTTDGSGISASCYIKVVKLAELIILDESSISATIGSQIQLTATVLPEETSDKGVRWSSSDDDVATVDNDGLVKIISSGRCEITASTVDGSDLTAKCEIQTVSDVKGIRYDYNTPVVIVDDTAIRIVGKDARTIVRVFSAEGTLLIETADSVIDTVPSGLYIVRVGTDTFKVRI